MENNESLRDLPKDSRYKIFADFCQQNYCPISRPQTAQILAQQVKHLNPKNILEIGTAIGYSGSVMLDNSNANLTTIEKSEEMFNQATKNFKELGLNSRVNLILDDALNALQTLVSHNKTYEFVFLDGPKAQYIKYIPYIEKLLCKNGVLVADDVMFFGYVKNPESAPKKNKSIVNKLIEFLQYLKQNKKFKTEILDVEDGVAIATKIED